MRKLTQLITKMGLTAIVSLSTAHANMINFGDSISDVGNNNWVKITGKIGAPLTNRDKTNGTNPIWVNIIAQLKFNNDVYSSKDITKLHLDPTIDNISYAWASAETGSHYVNDITVPFSDYNDQICLSHGPGQVDEHTACVPGVELQVAQYLNDVQYKPSLNTVFILWAGGNDIMNNLMKLVMSGRPVSELLVKSISTNRENTADTADLSFPIVNLLKAKNDLIAAGVSPKKIYIINLPDSSKFPVIKKLVKINPEIKKLIHTVSTLFNVNLIQVMTKGNFTRNLPVSHIYFANDLLDEILANPAAMGFNNVTDSCAEDNAMPNCEGYLFFDDVHPTVASSKIMGMQIAKFIK